MPPQVILLMFLALFGFIFLIARMKNQHELQKIDRMIGSKTDNSLTTGELDNMIQEAVKQAMEPLTTKMDGLASRLDSMEQQINQPLLDQANLDEEPSEAEVLSAIGRHKTLGRIPKQHS